MKSVIWSFIILLSILSGTSFGADKQLKIEGKMIWYFHGFWEVSVEEYGKSGGAKFNYKAWYRPQRVNATDPYPKRRTIEKNTVLSKGEVELLEELIKVQTYFSLEKRLADKALRFHQQDYRLKVCFDEKCHQVWLYDPSRMPNHLMADAEKFKAVWNMLWEFVKDANNYKPEMVFKSIKGFQKDK